MPRLFWSKKLFKDKVKNRAEQFLLETGVDIKSSVVREHADGGAVILLFLPKVGLRQASIDDDELYLEVTAWLKANGARIEKI
jgi:hypothetical protein